VKKGEFDSDLAFALNINRKTGEKYWINIWKNASNGDRGY